MGFPDTIGPQLIRKIDALLYKESARSDEYLTYVTVKNEIQTQLLTLTCLFTLSFLDKFQIPSYRYHAQIVLVSHDLFSSFKNQVY